MRKCVLLLPEIERARVWESRGFGDIYESAETNDDRENTQTELTTILPRKAENAANPHQKAIEFFDSSGDVPTPPPPKVTIAIQIDKEIADQLEKLKAGGDWNQLMKELLAIREAKLQEQKPAPVKTESRHIPIKIKRHVIARTNGTCSFPDCTRPHKILHHVQRFALEKIHDPSRIVPLCETHERLAHLSLIENEDSHPARWKIRLQPDKNDPKRNIDLMVGKYRNGAG